MGTNHQFIFFGRTGVQLFPAPFTPVGSHSEAGSAQRRQGREAEVLSRSRLLPEEAGLGSAQYLFVPLPPKKPNGQLVPTLVMTEVTIRSNGSQAEPPDVSDSGFQNV